jgi:hypothetical protein
MRKWAITLLLVSLFLPLMASCRAEPLAPLEPIVVLLSPGYGATLVAGPVEVRVYTENITLTENTGQPNNPSEGHIIYYMDATAPITRDSPATTAPGSYSSSTQTSYTWPDVAPGQHTFTVQLVNNDDTPFISPVTQRVIVNVVSR